MTYFKRSLGITTSIATSLFVMNAWAAQPGIYIGGQMGWGHISQNGISSTDMQNMIGEALGSSNFTLDTFNGTQSGSGFTWRVLAGYQIGYFWALEVGWAIYPRLGIDATASGVDLDDSLPYAATTNGNFKTGVFDFVGKGIWPLECNFNLYGKLGLAFVTVL